MKLHDALVDSEAIFISINDEYVYHSVVWYDFERQILCVVDERGNESEFAINELINMDVKIFKLIEVTGIDEYQ